MAVGEDESQPASAAADEAPAPKPRGGITLLELLVVIGITCLLISILLPPLNRMRDRSAEMQARRCVSNLNRLGMALAIYARNGDVLPPTLDPLIGTDVSPEMLVCPFGHQTPAEGATPEQIRRDFAAGGHMSYVYVGAGVRFAHPSNVVVAYDRFENHDPEGGYVLFADGRVDWLAPKSFRYLIDEVAAGRVPVDFSPLMTSLNPTTAATTVPTR